MPRRVPFPPIGMVVRFGAACVAMWLALPLHAAPSPLSGPPPIRFTDATAAAGLKFRHAKGGSGGHYYPEQLAAGVALLDYDRDGLLDMFFVQGSPLPGYEGPPPSGDILYRNNGDGTFTDVSKE